MKKRDQFDRERDRCAAVGDPAVRGALLGFADALDPVSRHAAVPEAKNGRRKGEASYTNTTAKTYLMAARTAHVRGLDLLGAEVETVNRYFADLVTEPERRRHELVEWDGSVTERTAHGQQAALRAFYRWATDPDPPEGDGDGSRPDTAVSWGDVNGSGRLRMFSLDSERTHRADDNELPDADDLDAMRQACLESQNTRRDRAFLELSAGTGQRVYPLVTLRVKGVRDHVDSDVIYLNRDIDGDGDKGAIEKAGPMRPFVADAGPVNAWLDTHPLRDPEVRDRVGAPETFGECFLFIGDLNQAGTNPAAHWADGSAREMLERRKADTAELPGVKTVTAAVNPHSWRAYAYTRSKDLPLDESVRRAVFGWSPGSDVGETHYNRSTAEAAMEAFAEAHRQHASDDGALSVDEQVAGASAVADLSPEARRALAGELMDDIADELDGLVRERMAAAFQLAEGHDRAEADGPVRREADWSLEHASEGNLGTPVHDALHADDSAAERLLRGLDAGDG